MKSINEANRRNEEINRVIKDIIDSRARLSQSALKSSEPDHLFSRIDGGSLIPKDIPQVETVKEIGYSPVLAEDRLKTIVKVLHKSVKP